VRPVNNSSLFTQAMLDGYGKALSPSQLEALRSRAKSQGSYYTRRAAGPRPPGDLPERRAVLRRRPERHVTIQNELDAYD
jgi:hypothetical protein